jgi:3-hydroxyanthranilate 3,4-dioxygenase
MKLPFNLFTWIEENRDKLRPPVGNQQLYIENSDFIVMIVGGPNNRKDFHYNEGEEFFFQLQGDITLRIQEDGQLKNIPIKEGEIYLLPPRVPHSPQRGPNTVGLVIERYRRGEEKDGVMWFCENCEHKLYEEYFALTDIVVQLPQVMQRFYRDEALRTCDQCNTIMQPPQPK